MPLDKVNELCVTIAVENVEQQVNEYADELDMKMLLANPRFYGPDYDSNDCDSLFYWELK